MVKDFQHQLKLNIFSRAKTFIELNKSFAPFGITIGSEIRDIMFQDENEEVDVSKGIAMIEEKISVDLRQNVVEIGGLAFDVSADFDNADGVSEKRDALCLKFSTDGFNYDTEYFPYMVIDGECIWR